MICRSWGKYCDTECYIPKAPKADFEGSILPAPGELEDVFPPPASSFFPEDEAGVDLAEEGLKGSFLLPPSPPPFSLGDLLPLLLAVPMLPLESSSSTTRSASLLSPSLSSFFIFLASGDRLRSELAWLVAGDIVLCEKKGAEDGFFAQKVVDFQFYMS